MKTQNSASGILSTAIAALFILLLVLQGLDLHSTITAPPHRSETNPVIVWIASHWGIVNAMLVMKMFSVLVILGLAKAWMKGTLAKPTFFLLPLLFLNTLYVLIVANNYKPLTL